MDGDDHEGAGAIDVFPQPVEDLHLVAHVERAGGFIQQQQLRRAQQALGQQHQLLLAAGQRVHAAAVQVADAEFIQHANGLIHHGVVDAPAQPLVAPQQHGLGDADVGTHVALLRHVADLAQLHGAALPVDGAAEGMQGGDGVDQGGLAGAVGADEADNLARFQPARDVLQDGGLATHDTDGFQFEAHVDSPYPSLPRRAMMANSMGTPATAVMMPTGMTAAGEMNLPNTEAPTRMTAPMTAASGSE